MGYTTHLIHLATSDSAIPRAARGGSLASALSTALATRTGNAADSVDGFPIFAHSSFEVQDNFIDISSTRITDTLTDLIFELASGVDLVVYADWSRRRFFAMNEAVRQAAARHFKIHLDQISLSSTARHFFRLMEEEARAQARLTASALAGIGGVVTEIEPCLPGIVSTGKRTYVYVELLAAETVFDVMERIRRFFLECRDLGRTNLSGGFGTGSWTLTTPIGQTLAAFWFRTDADTREKLDMFSDFCKTSSRLFGRIVAGDTLETSADTSYPVSACAAAQILD